MNLKTLLIGLLGIHMTKMTNFVHADLNFNLHISNISKSADKQLNAFMRSKCFLAFEEKMVLINSLILLNFYYSPFAAYIIS